MKNSNLKRKIRRQARARAKMLGTKTRPRISVARSNKYIYAQVIDDTSAKTIASYSSLTVKVKGTKMDQAKEVGKQLAEILKKHKISNVLFDRGSYIYKGRVKAFVEGLRENTIKV